MGSMGSHAQVFPRPWPPLSVMKVMGKSPPYLGPRRTHVAAWDRHLGPRRGSRQVI